jgi:hypothetical protein
VNTNLWKYALPVLSTAAAAAVGICLQPQSSAAPGSGAPQTIASSTHESVARSPAQCLDAAGKRAPQQVAFDDLVGGCSEEQQ